MEDRIELSADQAIARPVLMTAQEGRPEEVNNLDELDALPADGRQPAIFDAVIEPGPTRAGRGDDDLTPRLVRVAWTGEFDPVIVALADQNGSAGPESVA